MSSSFAGRPWTRRYNRIRSRSLRHGSWRQDYVDCEGMCQFPVYDELGETVCGEKDVLELHHFTQEEQVSLFADSQAAATLLGRRVLLCRSHHMSIHGFGDEFRGNRDSMLVDDVDWEIRSAGSLRMWARKYGVKL